MAMRGEDWGAELLSSELPAQTTRMPARIRRGASSTANPPKKALIFRVTQARHLVRADYDPTDCAS
jgi:hypothetical protein